MRRLGAQQRAALVAWDLARGKRLGSMATARRLGVGLRAALQIFYNLSEVLPIERNYHRKWYATDLEDDSLGEYPE